MSEESLRQEFARVQQRLDRERRARAEAESLAETGTRELYERQRQLELLHVIADAANGAHSVEAALQVALNEICGYTGWPLGHVYLTTREASPGLATTKLWHIDDAKRFAVFRRITELTDLRAGEGLPGRVLSGGRSVWIVDVTKDGNFPRREAALAAGVHGAFAFPVMMGTKVVAVLEFFSQEAAEPDETWLKITTQVGTQLGRIFERNRADEALREGEARFRQVVENIHEAIWMTEVESNRVLYASPRFEEIWGRSCGELYASPDAWSIDIHPEDREPVMSTAGASDHTYRIIRPDGAVRWIRHRVFPVKDVVGSGRRLVSVAEDVTERRKLEEQFLRAQRMEAIGTLASGVAHDLNNILAPVLLAAELAKERAKVPRDRALLEVVEQGTQRGADIIKQLLTFSRGVEGKRTLMQPADLLKEMTDIMRETFPREISIMATPSGKLWAVTANPTQLHQVVMNLCVNARDAMPHGGRLTLAGDNLVLRESDRGVHAEAQPGRYVVISVSDTGRGIPRENLARIFDPFFTTKELGQGSGLGLSTASGIVKGHGGFMTVYSETGRGSVFKIYLPAASETAVADPKVPDDAWPEGNDELILIVDDEPAIRHMAHEVLEAHGYRVITAENGRAGIDAFLRRRDEVRLVLTDVMMPEMGGPEFVRTLRTFDANLKVIAATGLDEDTKRTDLSALGVTDILMKPFDVSLMLRTIQRQLAGFRSAKT